MSETVEECACESLGPEDLSPFVEGKICGHEDRSSLVTLAEDLEQELSTGLGQGNEAEFIDNEQLETGQFLLKIEQSSLIPGLDQLVDQCGGGGKADRQPPLTCGKTKTEGDVSLAGAAVPDGDDVLVTIDVLAAGELHDQVLVHRRDGQEVEGIEALGGREWRAALILRSTIRWWRLINSSSDSLSR